MKLQEAPLRMTLSIASNLLRLGYMSILPGGLGRTVAKGNFCGMTNKRTGKSNGKSNGRSLRDDKQKDRQEQQQKQRQKQRVEVLVEKG
jgi:hypothetical protein